MAAQPNGTDPSRSSPELVAPLPNADEQTGRALRYFLIVLGLCSAVAAPLTVLGGALYALDVRADQKVSQLKQEREKNFAEHEKRPHDGVATKADIDDLKHDVRENREVLREVLKAVRHD